MLNTKPLREEFSRLHDEGRAVIEKAATESRELTDDEKNENENRFKRMNTIKAQLEDDAKFAGLALTAAPNGGGTGDEKIPGHVELPGEAPGREEFSREQRRNEFAVLPGETPEAARQRLHRDAVNEFIRTGRMPDKQFIASLPRDPAGQFTLITTTGSSVLVPAKVGPPQTIQRQRNPFRAALMARGLLPLRTTDSASVVAPIFDDAANTADVIAQSATGDNPKDPALTGLTLAANLYDSGTVWVSNMLINSSSFDLLAYLEPMLDERIDRTQVAAWIVQLQAATIGKTTASTTGVTYAELLDWQHSIPLTRRGDGVFFVADGLLRAIRGLVDSTGQPIFQKSMRDETPDTLLGWPIFPVDGLPTPAAGAVSGVAASASALVVRDVTGPDGARRIARYANQPNWPDQVGIRMFQNGGFNFLTNYVRTLKHAAS